MKISTILIDYKNKLLRKILIIAERFSIICSLFLTLTTNSFFFKLVTKYKIDRAFKIAIAYKKYRTLFWFYLCIYLYKFFTILKYELKKYFWM